MNDISFMYFFVLIIPAFILGMIVKKTKKTDTIPRSGNLKFIARSDFFKSITRRNPIMPSGFSSDQIPYSKFEYTLEGLDLEEPLIISLPISALTPSLVKELESINEAVEFGDTYESNVFFKTPKYLGTKIPYFDRFEVVPSVEVQCKSAKPYLFNLA